MALDSKSLKKLQKALPVGYAKLLKVRLAKRDLIFHAVYIYQCINPAYPKYNQDIIDEAILLLSEIKAKDKSHQQLIDSLTNW